MALSKLKPFNHYQLQLPFVGGEERVISWCQTHHVIAKSRTCRVCGCEAPLQFRKLGDGNVCWRCHRSVPMKHDWVESAAKHTWFEDSKFGIVEILELSATRTLPGKLPSTTPPRPWKQSPTGSTIAGKPASPSWTRP
ncbi:unnamed protein product [Allacma fusca]|uniref:Uncharacterized protein n=1 Tax=Allacma fusca TaxID=39272 RepID=A0A8J2KNZ5_9HEXA|nr:unnamed protein product [Allacma fusca]